LIFKVKHRTGPKKEPCVKRKGNGKEGKKERKDGVRKKSKEGGRGGEKIVMRPGN